MPIKTRCGGLNVTGPYKLTRSGSVGGVALLEKVWLVGGSASLRGGL